MDKLGSRPFDQIFPSILRMLCAKMCAQEIRATIPSPPDNSISHPEPTGKQQQGTLNQFSPPSLRRSTNFTPHLVWALPSPPKNPQIIPPPPVCIEKPCACTSALVEVALLQCMPYLAVPVSAPQTSCCCRKHFFSLMHAVLCCAYPPPGAWRRRPCRRYRRLL